MSLCTPKFTSFPNTTNPVGASRSTQHAPKYIDLLRGLHLFLSTQGEELSPPSRPSSPSFEGRVSSLRDSVQEALIAATYEPAKGAWAGVSEKLKIGCLRGKCYVACDDDQVTLEDTTWILPESEEDWLGWERGRQEARKFKKQATQTRLSSSIPASLPSAVVVRTYDTALEHCIPSVSPKTRRLAEEKVKRWQALTVQEASPHLERAQTSFKSDVDDIVTTKAVVPKKSNSLNFPVVKRFITVADRNKGHSVPVEPSTSKNRGDVVNLAIQSITSRPSIGERVPKVPYNGGNTPSESNALGKPLGATDGGQKISGFPETPCLPPSFSSQIATSTPCPQRSQVPLHAMPPSSSTPPPHTPLEGECHEKDLPPADLASPQPPQFNVITPVKELSTSRSQPFSAFPPHVPEEGFSDEHLPLVGIREGSTAIDILLAPPATPPDNDSIRRRLAGKKPSPTKSHFSSHAASPSPSPEPNHNVLFSPGSPIFPLSKGFLPQCVSTQDGPLATSRAGNGLFGMGYSSQFNVEEHVERVTEILDKEIDLNSWLNDANTLSRAESNEVPDDGDISVL